MIYDLPISVEIDGKEYKIRDECDYRIALDTIEILNDEELTQDERIYCAIVTFFIDYEKIISDMQVYEKAVAEMFKILNNGEETTEEDKNKPKLMDWEQDFKLIAPPVSRVLGYSVRSKKYTHWYDFVGAYLEIGDCAFANIMNIREKRRKGIKLDKSEREFYQENKNLIDLKMNLTEEQEKWLNEID